MPCATMSVPEASVVIETMLSEPAWAERTVMLTVPVPLEPAKPSETVKVNASAPVKLSGGV